MLFKIIILKQAIIKQQLYIVKDTKLDFQFLVPPTYNTAKYALFIFVAIAIAVFCVQLNSCFCIFYIQRFQELLAVLHIFFNNIICDLVLLFGKIACEHSFHYLQIKMFWSLRANRQGLPEKTFNHIFNIVFYVALCQSLCISNVPAVFFIKLVLTDFAKFTEST